ncbi:MAG: DUF624 domain-containing protein [Trebonia sp.]|jgi:uncharacterized membrane protein YesL
MTGILGTRMMAALAALFNVLALNLVLLLFSLPVITLPAAVSAATLALDRWRRDGEDQVVREFLIGFRTQFARQTVLVGVPLAAAVLGVIEVRHFALGAGAASQIALGFGAVALLVTASALGYVFLLAARGLTGAGAAGGAGPTGDARPAGVAGRTVDASEPTQSAAGTAGPAVGPAAEFWTLCIRLAIRNLFVTGPLFLIEIAGVAVLAWTDPSLLLLGLPLFAIQLMRVTANFGLRRASR